jgi:flagellar FliL protein
MADKEEAEGGAEASEVACPQGQAQADHRRGRVLAIVGGGCDLVLFPAASRRRNARRGAAAETAVLVEVPDMLVNLVGTPGERVQYLKVKIVLEVKEEKQVEAIKPTCRASPIFSRPICASCGRATSTVRPACFA